MWPIMFTDRLALQVSWPSWPSVALPPLASLLRYLAL